ncbi:1-phosphatidylinositol 4,5-bisphosphate phosphodiesterase gamma-2-like isoform X2 [Mytilus trossulus]
MAEQSSENVCQTAFMCQFCDQQNIKCKCEDCDIFLCDSCKEKNHTRLKSSDNHTIVYIKDIGKIQCYDNEPWYHGQMTRIEAETLLQKYKYMGDGAFLVRESIRCNGKYSIDFLVNGEPVHARILTKQECGRMKYFDGETLWFDFLNDLIESLKHSSHTCHQGVLTNKFTLTEPIPKE